MKISNLLVREKKYSMPDFRNLDIDVDAKIDDIRQTIEERPDAELGFYDELAFLYEHLYSREYDHRGQTQIIAENAENPEKILDVGCGAGHLIGHLSEKFSSASLEGIELHEGMAELAEKRFEGSERINIRRENVFDTDTDENYDIVTAFGVNPHFDEKQHAEFFEKAVKLLTEDGILVFDYKDPEEETNGSFNPWEGQTDSYRIISRFTTVYRDGQSYYACSYEFNDRETGEIFYTGSLFEVNFHEPERLKEQLEDAGLEVVAHRTEGVDQSGVIVARAER
jgi:2-polyprenyl-3-methyl-5-hydroxy-6-metoxy-1,4-benzoquinol methylase